MMKTLMQKITLQDVCMAGWIVVFALFAVLLIKAGYAAEERDRKEAAEYDALKQCLDAGHLYAIKQIPFCARPE